LSITLDAKTLFDSTNSTFDTGMPEAQRYSQKSPVKTGEAVRKYFKTTSKFIGGCSYPN